jgi:hypothetical protein
MGASGLLTTHIRQKKADVGQGPRWLKKLDAGGLADLVG